MLPPPLRPLTLVRRAGILDVAGNRIRKTRPPLNPTLKAAAATARTLKAAKARAATLSTRTNRRTKNPSRTRVIRQVTRAAPAAMTRAGLAVTRPVLGAVVLHEVEALPRTKRSRVLRRTKLKQRKGKRRPRSAILALSFLGPPVR